MSAESQNGRTEHGHLNEEWIRKYQSKGLAVQELQAAGRHLGECGTCRRVLLARIGPVRFPDELAEIPETLHLSYEQITGYIDGQLRGVDKEHVEAHAFICASCTREIDGLRKLDNQLAMPVAEVKPEVPKLSLWERISDSFRVPGGAARFGLAFGAIVAGVLLLIPGGRMARSVTNPGNEVVLSFREGLHLGGYALVIGGVFYVAYRLLRRR
jgi:hypothetical protein